MTPSPRLVLAALAAVVLTACGTTVPVGERQVVGGPAAQGTDAGLGQQPVAPSGGAAAPVAGEVAPGAALPNGDAGVPAPATGGDGGAPVGTATTTRSGTSRGATTAPGGSPAAAAQAPGGKVVSPVVVGFTVPQGDGNQANDQSGVSTGQSFTIGNVFRALVKAVNKKGGLAGRRIEPVYHEVNAAAASYETQYAAACADFTQDHKAVAVLTTIGYAGSFQRCLEAAGVLHVSGPPDNADEATLRKHRGLLSIGGPALERRERAVVAAGQELKRLSTGTVVGVLVDACPETRVAYDKGLVPAAKKAGLKLVPVVIDCANGYSDLGGIAASVSNAVLRFRQQGVTQVTFVSNVEATEVILFTQAAESQGYRPGYLLSSVGQPAALALNVPAEQLAGMVGAGWQPSLDVAVDKQPPRNAAQARCLGLLKSEGVNPKGSADYFFAYVGCGTVFAYERLLTDTGGRSGLADVVAAAQRIGTSLLPVSSLGTSYSADGLDGPVVRRAFRYEQGCRCFAYAGPDRPMP